LLQLFAILLAIACIPILLKRRIPVGPTLVILGTVAGVVGKLPLATVLKAFTDVFTVSSTLNSVVVVVEIGMLSVLMSHYGILMRAEEALKKLIPSARAIIMFMPALVGILQVPGGAALSAPFVNTLGKEMGLTSAQRSNLNVICRHVFLLLLPFSLNMVIVHGLVPDVSIFLLGMLNLGFVVLMQLTGYVFLVRKTRRIEMPVVNGAERFKALWEFALCMLPIFLVIALNGAFKIPYAAALPFSMLTVFFLCGKKEFLTQLRRSFSPSLAAMIIGVYFFQNIVSGSEDLIGLFERLISGRSQWVFLVMMAVVATLFGIATGLMYLPLGVLVPIAMNLPYASEAHRLIALSYTFCWCFIGYFFSPIHLCQLLSDQETGCTVGERYRTYIPFLIILPIIPAVLYFVYSLVLA
jgi:uncharacterized protein